MADETGTETASAETQQVAGNQGSAGTVTQPEAKGANAENGSAANGTGNDPFAELADEPDTREWLSKRELKDAKAISKLAHEQAKLLGNAIRIPGKDAKPEEIAAYREKLGVPSKADDYSFEVPKDLPPELPYDGERATQFKSFAHEIGLSKDQAKAVHDWATKNAVGDFKGSIEAENARKIEVAKSETEKLIKLWGPLDGEATRANLAFADKFLREVGGEEALSEFKRVGLIGDQGNVVLSAPIAAMFAKAGMATFKEDDVLKGRPDRLGNPFAEGDSYNETAQMKAIKENSDYARSLISAAGKKPADFGL